MDYTRRRLALSELEDTQNGKTLLFTLGEEVYGLESQQVVDVIGIRKISRLPESPDYVRGIIGFHGTLLPVIDMRLRLNKEGKAAADRARIVVANVEDFKLGLIVDSVLGFAEEPEDAGGQPLDCGKIFRPDELEAFRHIGEQ